MINAIRPINLKKQINTYTENWFNYTLYTPRLPNMLDDSQLVKGIVFKNYTPTIPLMQKRIVCFCAYASGRLRRRKRLFGLTQTLARQSLLPCTKVLCSLFPYFTLPVCLLYKMYVKRWGIEMPLFMGRIA